MTSLLRWFPNSLFPILLFVFTAVLFTWTPTLAVAQQAEPTMDHIEAVVTHSPAPSSPATVAFGSATSHAPEFQSSVDARTAADRTSGFRDLTSDGAACSIFDCTENDREWARGRIKEKCGWVGGFMLFRCNDDGPAEWDCPKPSPG